MSHKRIILSLIALAIALTVGFPAPAQDLRDLQFFAPPELSTYGGPRKANQGAFFVFDTLLWSISTPEVTTIGEPSDQGREVWYSENAATTATQNNSHNTSIFKAEFVTGQRFEGGYIYGHQGLLFRGWRLNHQTQTVPTTHLAMVFDDKSWGAAGYDHLDGYVDELKTVIRALPVTFASSTIRNRVETWNLELNYLLRSNQCHGGGYFEMFVGARYLEFNDEFNIHAYGSLTPVEVSGETVSSIIIDDAPLGSEDTTYIYTGTLANCTWYQDAQNHIVGPQIGARYMKYYGRWQFSTEGRFFAGFNSQNLYQTGEVGSELDPNTGLVNEPALPGHVPEASVPLALEATTFTHQSNLSEWSPGAEVALNLDWQWTRHVSLGAGWNGLWLDGIARASNLINYEFGTSSMMGILEQNNRQSVFVHGATFRISVNR